MSTTDHIATMTLHDYHRLVERVADSQREPISWNEADRLVRLVAEELEVPLP